MVKYFFVYNFERWNLVMPMIAPGTTLLTLSAVLNLHGPESAVQFGQECRLASTCGDATDD